MLKIVLLMYISVLAKWGQCQSKVPDDFKFGVATASYQVEGAWNESGKSLFINRY